MAARKRSRRGKTNATGRNETEQYFVVPYVMGRSLAWRSLSGAACKVWIELRCRFNGANNGEITLSLDEGARLLKLGKATIMRALAELEAKGFVVMTTRGQWYGRLASTWAVTDKPVNGNLATNAWKQWTPPKKQTLGSEAKPSHAPTVPSQNRTLNDGSISEPVTPLSEAPIGSEMDRYYLPCTASSEPTEPERPAERSSSAATGTAQRLLAAVEGSRRLHRKRT